MVRHKPLEVFKIAKNNTEERILNWKFCIISNLDYVLIKHTRSFILQVVQEYPFGNDAIEL